MKESLQGKGVRLEEVPKNIKMYIDITLTPSLIQC